MLPLISEKLVAWYLQSHRKLPWRKTKDPYRIWISEIILQQTRVEQGLLYYLNFIKNFPDIKSLASASQEKVLKQWQGLGYYSRARNLHHTAKAIVQDHNGKFPGDYEQLLRLKGIGHYTAAAIASFAFNLPHAVVDGNVIRVLSRLMAVNVPAKSMEGKRLFQRKADELLNRKQPALHNQAMMEFGALVCKPVSPLCDKCPLQKNCAVFLAGKVGLYPMKEKKNKQEIIRLHYLMITDGKRIVISKRSEKGIWKGLYEFPKAESPGKKKIPVEAIRKRLNQFGIKNNKLIVNVVSNLKHILSHRILLADCSLIKMNDLSRLKTGSTEKIIPLRLLNRYPVPRLMEKIMEKGRY